MPPIRTRGVYTWGKFHHIPLDFVPDTITSGKWIGTPRFSAWITPDTISVGRWVGTPGFGVTVSPNTITSSKWIGLPTLDVRVTPDTITSGKWIPSTHMFVYFGNATLRRPRRQLQAVMRASVY